MIKATDWHMPNPSIQEAETCDLFCVQNKLVYKVSSKSARDI